MLDIRVVFWVVCDEMVDIVVLSISSLRLYADVKTYVTPPAETETTNVVGY